MKGRKERAHTHTCAGTHKERKRERKRENITGLNSVRVLDNDKTCEIKWIHLTSCTNKKYQRAGDHSVDKGAFC